MTNVSRRGLFGLLGAGAASAILPDVPLAKAKEVRWYSGYNTFGPDIGRRFVHPISGSFCDIVSATLRNHKHLLSENISRENALLKVLKKKNRFKYEDLI